MATDQLIKYADFSAIICLDLKAEGNLAVMVLTNSYQDTLMLTCVGVWRETGRGGDCWLSGKERGRLS